MEKFDVPKQIDMEVTLTDLYWGDVRAHAHDAIEAIKALTGCAQTYLIEWKLQKSNLSQAIIDVVQSKPTVQSWGRILRISNHANDGLHGNLSEFVSSIELMRYLTTEAIIGDVTDQVELELADQRQTWDAKRAAELREVGWSAHPLYGDDWITDKGVYIGDLETAYTAWVNGYVIEDCSNCGNNGERCGQCDSKGTVKVEV